MKNLNAVKVQFSIVVLTQLLIQLGRIKSKFKGTLWEYLRSIRIFFTKNGLSACQFWPPGGKYPERQNSSYANATFS